MTTFMYVYEYFHGMFGHKGKGFILQLKSEVSQHLLYLPGTEAYVVYLVELKCSKPPSCCGWWVLHDKQASLSCSTGLCWMMKTSEPKGTASLKCMHVCLCMCVNVYFQVCLCVLTELINLSQPLSLVWFWQLFAFHLRVTSLWRISTCMCMLCVCVHYVSKATECVYVAHMLTIIRQFPHRNQWVGWKVYLKLHYISLQSVGMVVIQAMVNMLVRTNQGIFHLLVLQFIHHSGKLLHTLILRSRGVLLGYNLCVYVCVKEGGRESERVWRCTNVSIPINN